MNSFIFMCFLSIKKYSKILRIKIKSVYVKDFLISTKVRLKRLEHLQHKEIFSWNPHFRFSVIFRNWYICFQNKASFLTQTVGTKAMQRKFPIWGSKRIPTWTLTRRSWKSLLIRSFVVVLCIAWLSYVHASKYLKLWVDN